MTADISSSERGNPLPTRENQHIFIHHELYIATEIPHHRESQYPILYKCNLSKQEVRTYFF